MKKKQYTEEQILEVLLAVIVQFVSMFICKILNQSSMSI